MTVHKDALRELNIWPLLIIGGQDFQLTITVKTPAGVAQSLDGCTLHLQAKKVITDADADAVLLLETGSGIDHASPQTGATTGQATIAFASDDMTDLEDLIEAASDSQKFVYEVWVTDGAGNDQPVIDASPLTVRRGVWSPP